MYQVLRTIDQKFNIKSRKFERKIYKKKRKQC